MEEASSAGPPKPGMDCAFAKPEGMSEERRMAGAILRSRLIGDKRALMGECLGGWPWLLTLSLPIITRRDRFPSRYWLRRKAEALPPSRLKVADGEHLSGGTD